MDTRRLLLSLLFLTLPALGQSVVIGGDGPPAPSLTVTASTGTWTPVVPTSGPGKGLGPGSLTGQGKQAYINGPDDFCLFMPPDPTTQNLVDAESLAVAYCMNPFNGTRPMPDGFIKTAHFRKSPDYFQITGTYDPAVMNLGVSDCGGEYDNHGSLGLGNPIGAAVTNGHDFSQFIGACDIPGHPIFCLRAGIGANSYLYADNKFDLMGCLFTQPGDYVKNTFDSCDSDSGEPPSVYGTSTFYQGDSVTPTPHTAPASSNCVTTTSPSASGVTYTWNQNAVAAVQTTGKSTGSAASSGSSGSSGSNASSQLVVTSAAMLATLAGAALMGVLAL